MHFVVDNNKFFHSCESVRFLNVQGKRDFFSDTRCFSRKSSKMTLSCSSRMIKYLMFAFNLFFVISGIIIIAVGATVKTVYSDYSYFLDDKYFTLPNMLIATGSLIFFVSFFGCCGAIKENWIMLGVFSILLCIIFIFEFSAGIAGYVLRNKTIDYLDKTLKANLPTYANSSHSIWDVVQENFQCCGVDSYADWNGTFSDPWALPLSCCPAVSGSVGAFYCNSYGPITTISTDASTITTTEADDPITRKLEPASKRRRRAVEDEVPSAQNSTTAPPGQSTSQPYTTGCKTAFGNYIKKHAVQIGGCAIGLAIIQLLGILFSCHLVRQLKNGYYST